MFTGCIVFTVARPIALIFNMFESQSLDLLKRALLDLDKRFTNMAPFFDQANLEAIAPVLDQVVDRMADNLPYFHPLYAGQMIKPPHPVARLAYALAMYINPNNHAFEGGYASSLMEKEAVAKLAAMVGWQTHLGHLTGGGTMANLEALWVAGQLHPEKKILASAQAHYTHNRITEVLRLPFESVGTDSRGRMDIDVLSKRLAAGDVGTVVATLGTTATGAVDPLHRIVELQASHGFRIHVDAAYGGYYLLSDQLHAETRSAFDCVSRADSIVIDPHKHGLQPYGCGCVMFKDPGIGHFYQHDSPYTYFSSDQLHLGEISLECSRAGASAVALWATQQLLPLTRDGDFAKGLSQCRAAALSLYERLKHHRRFLPVFAPELDILVWAPTANTAGEISALARQRYRQAAERGLHLALVNLPARMIEPYWPDVEFDQAQVTCLRSCLMKPEHHEWLDTIWRILDEIAA
jgi:tyrosine decarboxylase/aspartate 1-decarboxylase